MVNIGKQLASGAHCLLMGHVLSLGSAAPCHTCHTGDLGVAYSDMPP
eukprot:CAMPEP_0202909592 /NCGR_PEP_ID=MMETSP1392-20130828/49731_1 /ASSEMBLY_ACC=CAM_ASM_000868 /TAXON_ID=225041 /ORGANISM="Chlamydomonas chlamydogama, Strain SAG 11-48b" /LENGTH=46 /DNA_ID= /DNA_START= /DNA_END= /DNA_ORIENTATION=